MGNVDKKFCVFLKSGRKGPVFGRAGWASAGAGILSPANIVERLYTKNNMLDIAVLNCDIR